MLCAPVKACPSLGTPELPALLQVADRRPGTVRPLAARLGGVDIPNQKRIETSLQYIYGIGLVRAKEILEATVSTSLCQGTTDAQP